MKTNQMTVKKMQDTIEKLSHDSVFGCYTRQAVELRWSEFSLGAHAVIFIDIDDMHSLNAKFGYNGVDERIKTSISNHRKNDVIAGRYYSGDEIIFIIHNEKIVQCAERIQSNFISNGLSVTIGISTQIENTLQDTVKPAMNLVQDAKKNNRRGSINY